MINANKTFFFYGPKDSVIMRLYCTYTCSNHSVYNQDLFSICRLAIVGVTDQYIHYKTPREKYIEDVLALQTHVSRLNHR